jgi:hypothetical protein
MSRHGPIWKENFLPHQVKKKYFTKGSKGKLEDNTLVYDADTGAPMDFAIENMPIGQLVGASVTHWTHICMHCITKFNVDINQTDVITTSNSDGGYSRENPACGVEWCENMSTHFYDFRGNHDSFVAAVKRVAVKEEIDNLADGCSALVNHTE